MRVPRATCRLQLTPDFTLLDAAGVVDHLAALGISDVYLSPILTVPRGAAHGYHVTDPREVNPELGGDEGLAALADALDRHGMGCVLDIVPNHLAASVSNPWWRDVLQHGRASRYASWFDVDWVAGGGRVVLPTLGGPLDEVVGDLSVDTSGAEPELAYFDDRFPLDPRTHDLARRVASGDALLADLVDRQHYLLMHWRSGVEHLNYRRFFDITDLVGLRVEEPEVFEARHDRILRAVADGVVTGLRVDHVDGLRDPGAYLARLADEARCAAGDGIYLVVEKILEGDEPLPEDWPVHGTTGYELLVALTAAQVDPAGLRELGAAYARSTGIEAPVADLLHARKLAALDDLFHGEVTHLTAALHRLAASREGDGDLPRDELRRVLVAVTAAFAVYRTYVGEDGELRPEDRRRVEAAIAEAVDRHPDLDPRAVTAVRRALTLDLPGSLDRAERAAWVDLVLRWQQLTGPAMAKGFEDTTFYVFNRLLALNEVGVDVEGMASPPDLGEVHARIQRRADAWPLAMNATSTHDTKRSEDVRARLAVLTEVPAEWAAAVGRWRDRTAQLRREVAGQPAPDANEEWLILQSLVGIWPFSSPDRHELRTRMQRFATKALREAKVHTSWLDPDEEHEAAVAGYLDGLFGDGELLEDLAAFVAGVALPGAVNSLAQVVLKNAAPGVPDLYQGTEIWDLSLVDPDNRRPIDWGGRRDALSELQQRWADDPVGLVDDLRGSWRDGRVKLLVTWRSLDARRRMAVGQEPAGYVRLPVTGEHADRVVAFARPAADGYAVAVAARWVHPLCGDDASTWPLGEVWGDTALALPEDAPPRLTDALTGRTHESSEDALHLADAFAHLPVALLVPE